MTSAVPCSTQARRFASVTVGSVKSTATCARVQALAALVGQRHAERGGADELAGVAAEQSGRRSP